MMKQSARFYFLQIITLTMLITLALSACQSGFSLPFQNPITGTVQPFSTEIILTSPNDDTANLPTTGEQITAAPTEIPIEQLSGQNIHDDAPLRFSFPTPQPPPISLWRPPLYPAPWALGPLDHFYFTRPIAADKINWPLADYRYGGIFFSSDIVHTGVDIPAPRGTPIQAAGPGKVMFAGRGLYRGADDPTDPYGLAVTIKHDFGYQGRELYTVYAHMDRIDVIPGQRVETGTQLGIVGLTGFTTGPHLHFEVRIENNSFFATRNPELWLAPPQGWGVLVGRLMNTNYSLLTRQDVVVRSLDTSQKWTVVSYGNSTINSDDNYRENLVLSDLPAGRYQISMNYLDEPMVTEMEIQPGAVTYFTFRGKFGYKFSQPQVPETQDWLIFTPDS